MERDFIRAVLSLPGSYEDVWSRSRGPRDTAAAAAAAATRNSRRARRPPRGIGTYTRSDKWAWCVLANSHILSESNRSAERTRPRLLRGSRSPTAAGDSPVADAPVPLARNCSGRPGPCPGEASRASPSAAPDRPRSRISKPPRARCDHPAATTLHSRISATESG